MKLTKKEKEFIKVIKRFCNLPEDTIIKVFQGLYLAHILNAYAQEDKSKVNTAFNNMEFHVPYIMSYSMKLRNTESSYQKSFDPATFGEMSLSQDLRDTIKSIVEGDNQKMRDQLVEKSNEIVRNILNISPEDLEDQ